MTFRHWTPSNVAAHNARVAGNADTEVAVKRTCGTREADLHDQIYDECRRRGWIVLHGSMSQRTHRTLGEWDFVIIAETGRVLLVECKIGKNKLSPEQQSLHHWARSLGHDSHVVRSIEEFLNLK
jgi:hypothetical protein